MIRHLTSQLFGVNQIVGISRPIPNLTRDLLTVSTSNQRVSTHSVAYSSVSSCVNFQCSFILNSFIHSANSIHRERWPSMFKSLTSDIGAKRDSLNSIFSSHSTRQLCIAASFPTTRSQISSADSSSSSLTHGGPTHALIGFSSSSSLSSTIVESPPFSTFSLPTYL